MYKKTCYYELLGVDRKASDEDIKKAYKKMALKHHPDKNRETDTKQLFQDLNEAYQVLGDPNERAWYDSHREQILRGTDKDDMSKEDLEQASYGFNIWPYFNNSCYKSFDEKQEKNFYSVYNEAFDKIKSEELNAYKFHKDDSDDEEELQPYQIPPDFGHANTPLDSVKEFYRWWTSFTTFKQFTWVDSYNTTEAPNRWVKRQMEKENKKERLNEKKKYVKTIKELVECCKRRDPRWKEIQEAARALEEKRKEQLLAKKGDDSKKKVDMKVKARQEEERRWAELDAEKANRSDEDGLLPEGEQYVDEFYCELCSKAFQSEAQLLNHNNSKGHKQQLKDLLNEVGTAEEKREMFEKSELEKTSHLKPTGAPQQINRKKKKVRKTQGYSRAQQDSDNDDSDDDDDSSKSEEQSKKKSAQAKKDSKKPAKQPTKGENNENNEEGDDDNNTSNQGPSKNQLKKEKKRKEKELEKLKEQEIGVEKKREEDNIRRLQELEELHAKEAARNSKKEELKKKPKGLKKKDDAEEEEIEKPKEVKKVEEPVILKPAPVKLVIIRDEEEDDNDEWEKAKFVTKKQENKHQEQMNMKKKQEEKEAKLKKKAEEERKKSGAGQKKGKKGKQIEEPEEEEEEKQEEEDEDLARFAQNIQKPEQVESEDDNAPKGKKGKSKEQKIVISLDQLDDKTYNNLIKNSKPEVVEQKIEEDEWEVEVGKTKLKKDKKKGKKN